MSNWWETKISCSVQDIRHERQDKVESLIRQALEYGGEMFIFDILDKVAKDEEEGHLGLYDEIQKHIKPIKVHKATYALEDEEEIDFETTDFIHIAQVLNYFEWIQDEIRIKTNQFSLSYESKEDWRYIENYEQNVLCVDVYTIEGLNKEDLETLNSAILARGEPCTV